MKQSLLSLIFSLCSFSALFAQTIGAPTLTAGVDGVLFQRGTLDAELIAAMIAEKQQEIKSEAAQRFVLNQLECGSFTMWNFARRNIETLLREKEPDVISKEILRNGAELMLVYGFAEYYLADLAKKSREDSLQEHEKKFLLEYFKWIDPKAKKMLNLFMPPDASAVLTKVKGKLSMLDTRNKLEYDETLLLLMLEEKKKFELLDRKENTLLAQKANQIKEEDFQNIFEKPIIRNSVSEYLPRPQYINVFNNANGAYSEQERRGGCTGYSPNHVLMDLIYEVCLRNAKVRRLGFFQSTGTVEAAYFSRNKFLNLKSQNDAMRSAFKGIESDIEANLNLLFTYFNTAKVIAETGKDFNLQTVENLIQNPALIAGFDQLIERARKDILSRLKGLNLPLEDKVISEKNKQLIHDLVLVLNKQEIDDYDLDNLHHYLQKKVIPDLITFNLEVSGKLNFLISDLEKLADYLKDKALSNICGDDKSISQLGNFLRLIEMLNSLDRVETYDYIFKFLVDVGNIMGSNQAKIIINALANGVDKYMIIDSGNNKLKIDVISFASDIYRRFAQNNHRSPVGVYFSVGLNNGFTTAALKDAFADRPSSIYFASEKVGLKWKCFDFKKRNDLADFDLDLAKIKDSKSKNYVRKARRRSSRIDRAPLVNNIYTFATVSGLLYQIEALNSEDDFNDPFYSLGFGAEFFNSLDFNLTYAVPFNQPDLGKGLINLGFDVKLFEYLTRLSEKRRQSNSVRNN